MMINTENTEMSTATTVETVVETTTPPPNTAPPKASKVKLAKVKNKGKVKKAKGKGKVKKVKAKKSKVIKPTTGQSAPEIEGLGVEDLNEREMRVVEALNGAGSGAREAKTIKELATECWKSRSAAQANSWVRNQLRRLYCGGWLEKMDRGLYKISEAGRKRLQRAEA